MKRTLALPFSGLFAILLLLSACATSQPASTPDPLPGWNEGPVKQSIVDFIDEVSTSGGAAWVPPNERIAVFDNDGTLWSEKPTYFQLLFILDRVKLMAAEHPEWASTQPFQAVLENDMAALKAAGEHGLIELAMATHAGMTTEEFETIVIDWLATARHPTSGRPYTDMVYQPMLDLKCLSFPVVVWNSCGPGPRQCMEYRPTRWLAAVSRPAMKCVMANLS